jgi:hypothetical protein
MEVGLRSTGKPVEKLPNPGATAPRFYSTNISINLYKKGFFAYELYIRYGNENSTNAVLK